MSVFVRSENEYATALSIWDPDGKHHENLLSLVKAIVAGDIWTIEKLFKMGNVYANGPISDDGGTALHLSCSCPPEVAVPTIDFLLKHPEVNAKARTNNGDSILHSLVTVSFPDDTNPFLPMIQNLLSSELVHLQNKKVCSSFLCIIFLYRCSISFFSRVKLHCISLLLQETM